MPRRNPYAKLDDIFPKVNLPKMQFGKMPQWKVKHFSINDAEAARFNMSQWQQGLEDRGIVPGKYTSLSYKEGDKWHVMMSDTPAERKEHLDAVLHNLTKPGMTWIVNGLGIGLLVQALLEQGASQVTVIENDPGIINSIGSIYRSRYGNRLIIIYADAYTWKPPKGVKWDAAWHDIWPTISDENLPKMAKLKRKYARRVKWQGAWAQQMCRDMRSGKLERQAPGFPAFLLDENMLNHFEKNIRRKATEVWV